MHRILAQSIKQDSEVQGIQVKGKEIKICQYVDDTTCFVRKETSVDKLLMILDNFGKYSRLKINTEKQKRCDWVVSKALKTNPSDLNGRRNRSFRLEFLSPIM